MLKDHARYNCNTPTVFETDSLNGFYWPGLRTSPWVDSLPWTRELRGEKIVAPLIRELKQIISKNSTMNKVPSSQNSSSLTSCLFGSSEVEDESVASREGNKAVLRPYNEGHGHDKLVEQTNKWRTLFLIDNGRENEAVCRSCPEIMKLVRRIPRRCSDVFISAISPGAKIRLHRGPTNTKLTCHLGLVVPSGDLGLKVGTETRKWSVGEWLLFNDSYPHEAWNHGQGVRYVRMTLLYINDTSNINDPTRRYSLWIFGLRTHGRRSTCTELLRRDRVKLLVSFKVNVVRVVSGFNDDDDSEDDSDEEETRLRKHHQASRSHVSCSL